MAPWEYEGCHSVDTAVGDRIVGSTHSRDRGFTVQLIDSQSSIILRLTFHPRMVFPSSRFVAARTARHLAPAPVSRLPGHSVRTAITRLAQLTVAAAATT
jgi:hypothetical protein